MSHPPQVEVYVQDCCWSTQHEEENAPLREPAPIPPALWESWFQRWLNELTRFDPLAVQLELTLRLTTDSDIQALNAQFSQKDQPTDVLAFAALEVDAPIIANEEDPLYLGDIVISVETAQRQAIARGHTLEQELAWLAAHGLLHLLGWDHPDDDALEEMLHQQSLLLQAVSVIPPISE